LAGWRAQRLYTPAGVKKGSASKALRDSIGSPPWKPTGVKRAWAAHHVVPIAQPGANDMRALMFRCHVHANSLFNGVYLRAFPLRKDKSAYDEVAAHYDNASTGPHKAAYHGNTQGQNYVRILRRKYLGRHLRANLETCSDLDVASDLYSGPNSDLEKSEFGVERPGE
jgi:hypothetical protein